LAWLRTRAHMGVLMAHHGGLEALSSEEEVKITYVRSKGGKMRTIPIWFTVHQGKMELLPMYGNKTKWYIDMEKSGDIELRVRDWTIRTKPGIVRDPKVVDQIKRRFAEKYGEVEVKKYYPTSEVALEVVL
jgi:hypothetical protein